MNVAFICQIQQVTIIKGLSQLNYTIVGSMMDRDGLRSAIATLNS